MPTWISFGTITRAHGVHGELRLVPHTRGDDLPEGVSELLLRTPSGERVVALKGARPTHDALLVELEGIADRDAAQALHGVEVAIDRGLLPPAEPGELYVYELEQAKVEDEAGTLLGTVSHILDNSGQDLLAIDTPQGERLLPLVPEMVLGFDRESRTLKVRLLPGLWDET